MVRIRKSSLAFSKNIVYGIFWVFAFCDCEIDNVYHVSASKAIHIRMTNLLRCLTLVLSMWFGFCLVFVLFPTPPAISSQIPSSLILEPQDGVALWTLSSFMSPPASRGKV